MPRIKKNTSSNIEYFHVRKSYFNILLITEAPFDLVGQYIIYTHTTFVGCTRYPELIRYFCYLTEFSTHRLLKCNFRLHSARVFSARSSQRFNQLARTRVIRRTIRVLERVYP